MLSPDYPRMMFHRTLAPVTVLNEEQEQALGPEWSRNIWPPVADASPVSAVEPEEKPAAQPRFHGRFVKRSTHGYR